MPCKRKDGSLSSHSSNIAIKKEQRNGGTFELKNSESRECTSPFKAIKDDVCPSNDPNHSETCKEKWNDYGCHVDRLYHSLSLDEAKSWAIRKDEDA